MLLVADSGSTKADWLLYDGATVKGPYHTPGFNPMFHDAAFVFSSLEKNTELVSLRDKVTSVKFFGAGCSSELRNEIIAAGLRKFFTKADVLVEHDLLACAFATCGDEPGIACIIGTGSNSCWFDGKHVHEKNYGLGFILGDEGSGSYYGKKLLTYFLYGLLPRELSEDFYNEYKLDKNFIIDHVYRKPDANVWLASFTRFLTKHYSHPYIKELIRYGHFDFLKLYVCNYENYREVKVHFVGSVAYLFSDELQQCCAELGITVGKIIKQPVDELMSYFIRKAGK